MLSEAGVMHEGWRQVMEKRVVQMNTPHPKNGLCM
jgi:hypothetical protein